jgi:histidine ammonia-lyase
VKTMTVTLSTRKDFTLGHFARVAWGGEGVAFSAAAKLEMSAARQRFMSLIEKTDAVIYGVTSGYGQLAKTRFTVDERKAHARRPPIQQQAAAGEPAPERVARGIVFARLANFIEGHSAISPHVAESVAAMLDGGPLPHVPTRGQGGAGEILILAPLFGALAARVDVAEKDTLSLINGSPAASALVADAALASVRRLDLACEVTALAVEAMNAPHGHYDEGLDDLWNDSHDAWALSRLRALLAAKPGASRRPYQAPVSYRILPRMLGAFRKAVERAQETASQSLTAVTDNPVFLPASAGHPYGRFVSTGGYHNPHAVAAMDELAVQSANLIVLAAKMMDKLLIGNVSLLPDQLGLAGTPNYMGCLAMANAGHIEEARMIAAPSLISASELGGFGQDDVSSLVMPSWKKQERAGFLLDATLANLGLVALRALEVTERQPPAPLQELAALIGRFTPALGTEATLGPASMALEDEFRSRVYDQSFARST